MDIARIIEEFCVTLPPKFEFIQHCCICKKDFSRGLREEDVENGPEFYVPYKRLAGSVCFPQGLLGMNLCKESKVFSGPRIAVSIRIPRPLRRYPEYPDAPRNPRQFKTVWYDRVNRDTQKLWEAGYCGKTCCHDDSCMAAFVNGKKKGNQKCIGCYNLATLDPDFEAVPRTETALDYADYVWQANQRVMFVLAKRHARR